MDHWLDPIRRLFGISSRPTTPIPERKTGPTPQRERIGSVNSLTAAQEFVEGLSKLGYFCYVDEADHDSIKEDLAAGVTRGYLMTEADDLGVYADRRLYHVDGENLSEGIADAIKKMAPILELQGVLLPSIEDTSEGDSVGLRIGDKEYAIYDWPNQEPEDLDTWGLGHKRLVEIVADLLVEVDSRERVYGIGWGNNAEVIFLTEDMYKFIQSSSIIFNDDFAPKTPDQMTLTHEM